MESVSWWTVCVFITDWVVRLGLAVRVIMRRLPIGASLAWLFIVLTFPFGGAVLYLMIGELRLGQKYAVRARRMREPLREWLAVFNPGGEIDWSVKPPGAEALARMCQAMLGSPVTPKNRLQLLNDFEATVRLLVSDIDAAQSTCHLEFYIWNEGGHADAVVAALVRAVARGVTCQVLVDDVGSREFLHSAAAAKLRAGGVAVEAAMPARLWRLLFVRFDLRMHRKIAIIDGRVAYTGSMNLVDPRYFKQTAGVGQWIDAMVRVEGPSVEMLEAIFLGDWSVETESSFEHLCGSAIRARAEPLGAAPVQVIPSGPAHDGGTIERILLATIYAAQHKLTLTTPYFVPDEALLTALISAAQRGVEVTLIVPAKVDSRLASLASRAIQGDLVAAGVRVLLFRGGLLHTKSVAVDGEMSLFGSLNLDPRSLHLNFEITLAIYDREFTVELEALQSRYAAGSSPMQLAQWRARSLPQRFIENTARLVGPLL
jgi:cardiolipin synthase A/B